MWVEIPDGAIYMVIDRSSKNTKMFVGKEQVMGLQHIVVEAEVGKDTSVKVEWINTSRGGVTPYIEWQERQKEMLQKALDSSTSPVEEPRATLWDRLSKA